MNRRAIYFLTSRLILFLTVQVVSAATTEINVKTLRNVRVGVIILDPTQVYGLLNSSYVSSGDEAFVSVAYTGDQPEIKIRVQLTENGKTIMLEKFDDEPFNTGSPLYLQVIPNEVIRDYNTVIVEESITNETVEVANLSTETEVVQESVVVENSSGKGLFTGLVTGSKGVFTSRITYYVSGGIILLLIIGFIIMKIARRDDYNFSVKKEYANPSIVTSTSNVGVAIPNDNNSEVDGLKARLAEAEMRLRAAQVEMGKMKNESKIREMERKIEEERKEIERLKNGGD